MATFVTCASATGVLHDEFVETADTSSYDASTAGQDYLSQSWQSGVSPRPITGVCMRMKRTGSPSGNITTSIFAHAGSYGSSSEPTGAALVTSDTFDCTTLGTEYGNYSFALSGWTPSSFTNYTVVLDMGGVTAPNAGNTVYVIYEAGAEATHGGNAATSADGSTWTPAGSNDLSFKIYEAVTGVVVTASPDDG